MHQAAWTITVFGRRMSNKVGKDDDLAAPKGTLTMHQAAWAFTVFGHRMSNKVGSVCRQRRSSKTAIPNGVDINHTSGRSYR